MLAAVLSNVDRVSVSDDDRGSGRICGNCLHFQGGLCLTKAAADWGDSSFVSANRKACSFAAIIPF